MLKFVSYIFCLALTFSSCKKDCNGSFTIEGTLWNGTKNKPRSGVLVEAVAGKGNSLFSTSSNVKDVGSARTDENGKFKINYNCVGDGMEGISLRSSDLQYSSISAENRLPINQNYSQYYNIPDSVSIKVVLNIKSFKPSDTVFLRAPNAPNFNFTDVTYSNRYYYLTYQQFQQSNYIFTRVGYPANTAGYYILAAVGYNNYIDNVKNQTGRFYVMNLKEPDINVITIDVP